VRYFIEEVLKVFFKFLLLGIRINHVYLKPKLKIKIKMKVFTCSIAAILFATFTISAQAKAQNKDESATKTEVLQTGRDDAKVVTKKKEVIVRDSDAVNQGRPADVKSASTPKLISSEDKDYKIEKQDSNGRVQNADEQEALKATTPKTKVKTVKKDN